MITTLQQLRKWIRLAESEHLEFQQAGRQFDSEKLTRYCVSLANEGGGKLILGVTDKVPRQVAGTEAFPHAAWLSVPVRGPTGCPNYAPARANSRPISAEPMTMKYSSRYTGKYRIPAF